MAHFTKEQKKAIAPKIAEIGKKYGVKATLAIRHHSTVVLNIASGEIDFIGNAKETEANDPYAQAQLDRLNGGKSMIEDYIDVNQYHMDKHFTGKALEYLEEVYKVLMTGNYNNDDVQTDYFDRGWYVDMNIGKWDKPYIFTGEAK